MKWSQSNKFEALQQRVGWAGDITPLIEFVQKIIPYLPKSVANDMRQFYIDNETPDRKDNGRYNTRVYQRLGEGRTALILLSRLTLDDLNQLIAFKQEGRW